ncbi:MAG: glycosyltransferase family 9 protein [Ignavibacteria bacterium]|nr:glycosyltransferase family 9 protein [Ignavibacteria bacterium]
MSQKNKKSKFLIVRTDNIGDSILTLPMVVHLKENFPESEITFLAQNYTKPILKFCKSIDEIIAVDDFSFWSLVKNLNKQKFDYAFLVYPNFKIALALFLARIPKRIGTKYRWYSFLLNQRVPLHRKYNTKHEAQYNISLLSSIGLNTELSLDELQFDVYFDNQIQNSVKTKLENLGVDLSKKIIILHVGSFGSAIDWKIENFYDLALLITKSFDVNIILTGSLEEKNIIDKYFNSSLQNIFNTSGIFNLPELLHLMTFADIYIGNSTGPTHIAAMTEAYVIGFYPKIPSCSQKRWSPLTKRKFIFEPTIDCQDCTESQCRKLNCMDSISVDSVFGKVKSILSDVKV